MVRNINCLRSNQFFVISFIIYKPFSGFSLLQFVRRCSEHHLYHEQTEIRLEAVSTCVRLLRLAVESTSTKPSPTVVQTVSDVLSKLLVVAITDVGECIVGTISFLIVLL